MRCRQFRGAASLGLLALLLLVAPFAAAAHDDVPNPPDAALTTTQANGVLREVLASGLPGAAPGQEIVLLRFTFAPGAIIPPHVHPGMQTAYVLSGTIGYTVLCGAARVTLPPSGGAAPRTEERGPGPEFLLQPGSSFTEQDGILHSGRNAGDVPLVLLVSSLLATSLPASIATDPQTAPQCGMK